MHPLMPVDRRVLARVRKIVMGWPAAGEAIKWGRPHFMAGKKLFANVGPTHERPSISMKVTPLLQADLVERPEFVLTPYSAHQGWVSMYTDTACDWDEIADYLRVGYRLVAQKKMLAAMDDTESKATRRSR
ncbi:MAG TPA: MmcQ/YjbR family DNA-binding protein [Gemmatimonadales bacterium]|nr:MmcQ/YjbR family DNA-binding protein [Gemmatimonadales bacterium]